MTMMGSILAIVNPPPKGRLRNGRAAQMAEIATENAIIHALSVRASTLVLFSFIRNSLK
jgi:hypothetical protein